MGVPLSKGKLRTRLEIMQIGDYISCEYVAREANKTGTFQNLGIHSLLTELTTEYPVEKPNGFFYFIRVSNNLLVADRMIQSAISWNSVAASNLITGKQIPGIGKIRTLLYDEYMNLGKDTLKDKIKVNDLKVWNHTKMSRDWHGGYGTPGKIYYFNIGTGKSESICLELSATNSGNSFSAVFDFAGSFSAEALLYDNDEPFYVYKSQSKSLTTNNAAYPYSTHLNYISCFRPVIELDYKNIYLSGNNEAYGIQSGNYIKLSDDWTKLTSSEKKTLFDSTSNDRVQIEDLSTLNKFKVISHCDTVIKPTFTVNAIPKEKLVTSRRLIKLEGFDVLDKAKIATNFTGQGACKIIVTLDLKSYQTYDFITQTWRKIDYADLTMITQDGIDANKLQNIPDNAWNKLLKGKSGIGFAYLPSIENTSDKCEVDKLEAIVNMKGTWDPRTM